MRHLATCGCVIGLLAMAGCSSTPAEKVSAKHAAPRPAARAPLSPAAYVAAAGSIDLFQIQAGELALARAADPRLRAFAERTIRSHRGTSGQLSLAGRRLNLLPPASMLPRHQAMLAELSASASFDAAYRRLQLQVHEEAVQLHHDYSLRGTSPTLRPVAAAALPIVQADLSLLKREGLAGR